MCADATSTVAFRDGYLLGAGFAALGLMAAIGLRRIDHDAEPEPSRSDRGELLAPSR